MAARESERRSITQGAANGRSCDAFERTKPTHLRRPRGDPCTYARTRSACCIEFTFATVFKRRRALPRRTERLALLTPRAAMACPTRPLAQTASRRTSSGRARRRRRRHGLLRRDLKPAAPTSSEDPDHLLALQLARDDEAARERAAAPLPTAVATEVTPARARRAGPTPTTRRRSRCSRARTPTPTRPSRALQRAEADADAALARQLQAEEDAAARSRPPRRRPPLRRTARRRPPPRRRRASWRSYAEGVPTARRAETRFSLPKRSPLTSAAVELCEHATRRLAGSRGRGRATRSPSAGCHADGVEAGPCARALDSPTAQHVRRSL